MTGRFISFEGGEGCGKSTQSRMLAEAIRRTGIEAIQTREPGGSDGAEDIRGLLVKGAVNRWDGVTETLLHYAARRDHVNKVILPAMERGCWVISDRFSDSTMAYQGYGHGIDIEAIESIRKVAIGDFAPDLTVLIDLPVEVGLERAGVRMRGVAGAEDRYEKMDISFHEQLRAGFLSIAVSEPERCLVIDGRKTVDEVFLDIQKGIRDRFGIDLSAEIGE